MNWQQLFMEHILDRGYDYFCNGAIEDLGYKDDVITATVCGTEAYDVEIILQDDAITDMYCSCPYAENGSNCKHMAAVLFEWENDIKDNDRIDNNSVNESQSTENIRVSDRKEKEVDIIVAEADEHTVRKFLTVILRDDEKLYARFKTLISPDISKEDMKRYKRQVELIVHKYLGREHFIGYHEAGNFISEIEEFLCEDVQMMLDDGCYIEAFELTSYIFVTVGNVDMDDSDGGTGNLADSCYAIWNEILEKADEKVRQAMYDWFIAHLNGSIIDYMEEYIEQILMNGFNEDKYLEAKLEFSAQKVIEKRDDSDSWSESYHASQWALKHITIMKDMGKNWSDIEKYCKENWKYSAIRKYYINEHINQKDYEEAITALKESLQMDSIFPGLVRDYSRALKDVYHICGKEVDYKKQLWQLMIKDDAGNVEIFHELKTQYLEEEWINVREKIFGNLPQYAHVERLYKEEKLYDRLLEYVKESSGLYALREFTSVLKAEYPAEILQKYSDEVNKMASRTADRKHYKELVSILRTMLSIKSGEDMVNEIAKHWRMAYGNRPAMMDELSRLYHRQ